MESAVEDLRLGRGEATTMENPKQTRPKGFEQRLAMYGVMSAAAAAALAPAAQAGVIIYDPPDLTTPLIEDHSVFWSMTYVNPPTNTLTSWGRTGDDFWLHFHYGRAILRNWPWGGSGRSWLAGAATAGYPLRLGAGAYVGPGGNFAWASYPNFLATSSGSYGEWNAFGRGYVGLRFQIGPNTHYGWAEISVNPNYTSTLHRWAYEDVPNTGLSTPSGGAIPEPASIVLMALGAAGLALYRKRRQKPTA
jgi:hypothetical protein